MAAALAVVGLGVAAAFFLAFSWPFRREAVIKELEVESLSNVRVGAFHRTYFSLPGCVLEHVVFQHNPKTGTAPLITIERIRIEGSFGGLFTRHVKLVRVEGMHILIPPLGSERFEVPQRSSVVVDDLVADGAILEVTSRIEGKPPLKFSFHRFTITDVGGYGPSSFKAMLSNPEPQGEITTQGQFGPWNADRAGKTPISGEYLLQHADLGGFRGISGLLSSSGKYSGTLERIGVEGSTDVPLFAVTSSDDVRSTASAVLLASLDSVEY